MLSKKLLKEPTSQSPILPIDTILHFGHFDFSLYKTGFFQLFQMLRHSSLGNR